RVLAGEPEVARERELEAATKRVARDRGDHGPRDRSERVAGRPEPPGDGASGVDATELVDVGPGRERLAAPEDHHRLHRAVVDEPSRGRGQLREQRTRQRVERRTVEAERHDPAIVPFDDDELIGHAPKTRDRRAATRPPCTDPGPAPRPGRPEHRTPTT